MTGPRRTGLLLGLGGGVLLLDQVTKVWIARTMLIHETRPLVPGILDLHYLRNTGGAFGFMSSGRSDLRIAFFIGVSLVSVGIILFLFRRLEASDRLTPVALSLVLGGAVGNLVDRIRLGEVIDFILVHYRRFQWPAFNVADIAISVGVGLLILRFCLPEGDEDEGPSRPESP